MALAAQQYQPSGLPVCVKLENEKMRNKSLLSSEDFNTKEGVTMYFVIHCGHFSNKIALLHF